MALGVVDVATDDSNVLGLSVVVLATVVSGKVEVKVLCSVVTARVGTVVLIAVVLSSTGVDSENVVVAKDDLNVLALSVVVLATVVSAKVEVKVLCSVVTGSVGTVVLCAVVPWSTGVDSENVVEWTDVLDLLVVELGSRVVPAEEYSVDCPVE